MIYLAILNVLLWTAVIVINVKIIRLKIGMAKREKEMEEWEKKNNVRRHKRMEQGNRGHQIR